LHLDQTLRDQTLQPSQIRVADAEAIELVDRLQQVFGARTPVADRATQHLRGVSSGVKPPT